MPEDKYKLIKETFRAAGPQKGVSKITVYDGEGKIIVEVTKRGSE